MAPQITKKRRVEHIKDGKNAAIKLLAAIDAIESIRFERDSSGTFYINAGSDPVSEFQDIDAQKLGFSDVSALDTYFNNFLDAVNDINLNYRDRIAPVANVGETI